MSSETEETVLPPVLEQAHARAIESHLPYAGGVPPTVAWELFSTGQAQLVDVRSAEER
ncbi:MAG TPA: rhodanese-like domain-containing protein, partial [Burkholderiaceae bacterium]